MGDNDPIYFCLQPSDAVGYLNLRMAVYYAGEMIEFYQEDHREYIIDDWSQSNFSTTWDLSWLNQVPLYLEVVKEEIDRINKELFSGMIDK